PSPIIGLITIRPTGEGGACEIAPPIRVIPDFIVDPGVVAETSGVPRSNLLVDFPEPPAIDRLIIEDIIAVPQRYVRVVHLRDVRLRIVLIDGVNGGRVPARSRNDVA